MLVLSPQLFLDDPNDSSSITLHLKTHSIHDSSSITLHFKTHSIHDSSSITLHFKTHSIHESSSITLHFKTDSNHDSSSITLHFKTHYIHKYKFRKILVKNTNIIAHEIDKLRLQILEALYIKKKKKPLISIEFIFKIASMFWNTFRILF